MVNLAEEGFDRALRVTTTLDEGLVARKLGAVRFHLVAAPALLNRIGRPTLVADLAGAPFLAYSPVTSDGRIRFGKVSDAVDIRLLPVMQSGNETLILLAAREGVGFAMMPPGVEQLRARGVGMVASKDGPPRVRFHKSQQSTVPARTRPSASAACAAGTSRSTQVSVDAGNSGLMSSPVAATAAGLCPSAISAA